MLGWQEQKFEGGKGYFYPPGFKVLLPAGPAINYPEGWTYEFNYEESLFRSGINLTWEGWDHHRILFKWAFSKTYFNDIWIEANVDFSDPLSIPLPLSVPAKEYSNVRERMINSFVLQDEFRVNDKLTITANLRNDDYNDLGNMFYPRLAAVYRMDKNNTFKAQYAQAFRPTTFFEMCAPTNPIIERNLDLKEETIDSYEVGYIYRGIQADRGFKTVGRITFFYSKFKNRIFEDNITRSYKNAADVYLKGAELEFEQKLGDSLKLNTNFSFVETKDQNPEYKMLQAPNWITNLGIIYQQPYNNLTLSIQYRYVGDRKRESKDPRGNMKGYDTVDVTGTIFDLGVRGLTLRMSIRNLFDEDVRFPAPLDKYWPFGDPHPTYPEDFPRQGRQWYIQLSYEF